MSWKMGEFGLRGSRAFPIIRGFLSVRNHDRRALDGIPSCAHPSEEATGR